jgi:hypothetical protein
LSSAMVLSSSDLTEKDKEEEEEEAEWGKGQEGVIGVESGEGVMLLVDDR